MRYCLLIFSLLFLGACTSNPASTFKVKDPDDPRFNPYEFSYLDTKGTIHREEIFAKMFPVGTDKKFVDKVLIESGGAFSKKRVADPQHPDWTKYSYIYRGTNAYRTVMMWGEVTENMTFYFDDKEELMAIYNGSRPVVVSEPEKTP